MSNNNNQGEPAMMLFMMLALVGGLGWLVWHGTHDFWIKYVFRWMRYVEVWPVHIITQRYGACLDWLRYAQTNAVPPQVIDLTQACFTPKYLNSLGPESQNYYRLTMPPLIALGAMTVKFYRWPLALMLAAIGTYMLFYSPRNKFMTKHTLESLIITQAKMWPIISPIVKFNPSKTGRILGDVIPEKLPMFAEALSPEEWVAYNRVPVVNGIPDRDAARRSFIRQLGPRWNGVDALPLHMRALMAAFSLKAAQKREASDEILGKLALAWTFDGGFRPDAPLVAEIDRIIRDPELGGKLLPYAEKHAYRTTALLGALKYARANGGVLAPAQFLWIRGEDRALWYPLNNLGRRSYHSEGAGAMAHFMAEEAAKKPLPIPRVDTAIVTLNTYLHDPDKRPIPIPAREGDAKA